MNMENLFKKREDQLFKKTVNKGRPIEKNRNKDDKAYERITISLTKNEKETIKKLASEDKFCRGNISMFIKNLLIKQGFI